MKPGSELDSLLWMWFEDAPDMWIDPYEVAEDTLDRSREYLQTLLSELDAWVAESTPQQRFERLWRNSWKVFEPENVEPFLAALRARIVAGLETDEPEPMAGPPHLMAPHDRPEGPYPELLRLARWVDYQHRRDGTGRHDPFLPPPGLDDAEMLTSYRLRSLVEMYHHRLLREIARLRADTTTERERYDAIGGAAVWQPETDADDWLDLVELLARYRVQRDANADTFSRQLLEELRAEAT